MHRLYKTFSYVLLSTLATVWGCHKDVEEFRPYVPIQEDLEQLLSAVPSASSHTTFHFGGSIPDTTLTTAGGVRVFLADTENLFADDAGTPVPCSTCSDLRVEVTGVFDKSDLLARRLSTTESPDLTMLESVGIVRIQVFCQNQPLQLLAGRYIKIQAPSSEVKPGMQVFEAVQDTAPLFYGWKNTGKSAFWADWPLPGGNVQSGYEWLVTSLGWSNCARPLDAQTSSFCITLPSQFNELNTRAFLVFDNVRALAELKGNDQNNQFCFDEAPFGYPVKIVAIGKTGEQYWLVQIPWEIGTNTSLNLFPKPLKETDVLDFIKSL